MEKEVYNYSTEQIFNEFKVDAKGIAQKEASKRQREHGYNEITERKKDTVFSIFIRQFRSFIVWVLALAAGISYATGHYVEFVVIIIIILSAISLSFFEEYKASKDMAALVKLTPKKAKVIRDGKHTEILAREITIGDILVLNRGDIVSADARLVESNNIQADESALTGESVSQSKHTAALDGKVPLAQQSNMVFAGTQITNGNGLAVVVSIGDNTQLGHISTLIQSVKEEITPLQKRLDKLGKQISLVAMLMAGMVFVVGISKGTALSTMIVFSLAMLVSGIPESLPTVVAVTLAAGVKKMAKRNAIIKRMPAVETLGTCTVICSDKTGTLTENKMVIESIYTSDAEVSVTGEGYTPKGLFLKEDVQIEPKKHKTISKILEIGVLCNNADIKEEKSGWTVEGEPTEAALVVLARKAGIVKHAIHRRYPRKLEHPFDPVRKCMSTIHKVSKHHIVYTKGAPEVLLKKAKYYFHQGQVKKLTSTIKSNFLAKQKNYAAQGLRVLALAYKEHKGSFNLKSVESGLIFVGLVSMRDPPKQGVSESIELCKQAGTKVVMITGDNEVTAKAIASQLGILNKNDTSLTGKQLDRLDDPEFSKIANSVTVYARVTPEHKLRIVKTLQQLGHVVAMTGDGVNDAPALKKADIGISMGLRGTEVAKEASELILKDDNFTTIVNAIEEGRTIYANIRKFIYYLLVGNFSEVLIFTIAILVGASLPLTALMILFLNLVTSELPALGLSVEKASAKIMQQRPRDPKEGILSDYLLLKISQLVPLVVLGTISVFIWMLVIQKVALPKAQTMAFATIILFELFHALNARSWDESIFSRDFFTNPYVLGGISFAVIGTLAVIYIPFLQSIFGTIALTSKDWVPVLLVSLLIVFFTELQKTLLKAEFKERAKMEIYPTRGQ